MRQSVGPLVQFAIAQALSAVQHRQRLRRALHLLLEQPMNGLFQREMGCGVVEILQYLPALVFRQDLQIVDRGLRCTFQCLHQARQGRLHVGADLAGINPAGRLHAQQEAFALIVHRQHARIVGPLHDLQHLGTCPTLDTVALLERAVPIVQQRTEQRQRSRHATATLGQCQRGMFVAQQGRQARVDRLDSGAYALPTHIDAQRQGIDEHAQGAVRALAALHAAQQHGAEDHVFTAGHTPQYPCPRQVVQGCRAHAELTRLLPQTPAKVRIDVQLDLFDAPAIALDFPQAERQRRFVDIREHVAEEALMLLTRHAQQGLRHVITVRHGRFQAVGLAIEERQHLLLHHVQRGVVQGDMVEQQNSDPTLVHTVPGTGQTHQRRLVEVHPATTRIEHPLQLRGDIAPGRIEVLLFEHQPALAQNHLQRRLEAFAQQRGPQDVMPVDHGLQGCEKAVELRAAVHGESGLQQIGVAFFGGDVVVENAFLQRRQRVDVLDIAGTARHTGDDPVEGILVQLHQRQHRRGDSFAARHNAVGRHAQLGATAHCRGQGGQGRLAEQHPHIGAEPRLAHQLDQLHRQQRMPAQLEEMIVPPHLPDTEHVSPQPRQRGFHLAQWRFVRATGEGVRFRDRQRTAVEFAVGRQGQFFQPHVGRRNHVVRQQRLQVRAQCIGLRRRIRRLGSDVGHQAFLAGLVFTGDDGRFLDSAMLAEPGLDLTQLDTEAADLDLIVVAAQVLDMPVGQVAAQVSSLVQARLFIGRERIADEALGGQVIAVQIATGNANAADVDLAGDTDRNRLLLRVQQVDTGVGHRLPDGGQRRPGGDIVRQRQRGGDVGLGRPIVVVQAAAIQALEQRTDLWRDAQLFASGDDILQVAGQRHTFRLAGDRFGQGLQGDAWQVQAFDALLADMLEQAMEIQADVGVDQRQFAAGTQGAENLLEGNVKAKGRELQGACNRAPLLPGLCDLPLHQVDQGPVRHGHALGLASRTRGVDDIRQAVRAQAARLSVRVSGRLPVDAGGVAILTVEQQGRHTRRGEAFLQAALGQQHLRCAVFQHVGQALGRVSRIQRHIAGPGLEDTHQPGNHFQAALHANRHPVVGMDTPLDQTMGDLVGQPVQLTVAQALPLIRQRNGLRLSFSVGLEQLMDQQPRRVHRIEVIEVVQQLLAFAGGDKGQRMQRGIAIPVEGIGQCFEHGVHVAAHPLRADPGHGLHGQSKRITEVIHRQRQRVIGPFFAAKDFRAGPDSGLARILARLCRHGGLPIVHQRTEQRRRRRNATASLCQRQRRVFVAQQRRQAAMGRLQRGQHPLVPRLDPQRQGVDEHAQGMSGLLPAVQPAHQYGAEHYVLTAGQAPYHLAPGQVVQAGGTDPQAPGLGTQTPGQPDLQRQRRLFDTAAVALHILQAQRQRRLVHIAEHLAEKRLMLLGMTVQADLSHVVAIRHRHRQLRRATLQVRVDFLAQHAEGGRVIDQVMEQQHRHPAAAGSIFGKVNTHHRRLAQIEAGMARIETDLQLVGDVAIGRVQGQLFDHQARLAPDHLHRLAEPFPRYRGAQDVVPGDDRLQGMPESFQLLAAAEAQQCLQQVRIAFAGRQVVIENAFLQRHQAVDILHIVRAARHGCDNAIDFTLGQARQGQHVRSNALDTPGNPILRHHQAAAGARGSGQGLQRRLAEQHAHVGVQVQLAHAFDQLDRQQRVAAQFEETVVTSHLLDTQQLGPQRGQGGFHLAHRRFIAATGKRLRIGSRQRLAVELAVGGQREGVEHHEGARHHVVRQRAQQLAAQLARRHAGAVFGKHIGHQPLVPRLVFPGDHHGLAHFCAGRQPRFDFAQLDTEAADFHLLIVAPQVLQFAVVQPTTEVAGTVHPRVRSGVERIGQEPRFIELRPVQVASRHTGAPYVQLALHALGHRLAVLVQQVQAQIGNPLADRADTDQLGIGRLQRPIGHMHRGFGDAIHVHQLRAGIDFPGVPRLEDAGFQGLAAENHLAQVVLQLAFALGRDQLAERARRLVQHRDTRLAHQRIAILRRTADQLRHHQQATAVGQRAPDFPDREVEGEGMEQRPHVLRAEVEPRLRGREQPRDVAVLDHHPFGQAGRARGVDHVGQVMGCQGTDIRIVPWLLGKSRGFWLIEQQHRDGRRRHLVLQRRLGQQRHRRAVLEHEGQAVQGIGRIQRHIAGTGLQDTQQANDHVQAAFDADGYPIIREHPQGQQPMGDLVRPGIQFAVGQGLAFMDHRHRVRLRDGPRFEQAMDRAVVLVPLPIADVPGLEQTGFSRCRQDKVPDRQRIVTQGLFQHVDEAFGHRLDFIGLQERLVVDPMHPGIFLVGVGPEMDRQGHLFLAVGTLHRIGRGVAEPV
ncbi:hypothetical protein SRABI112_01673 [Pseudomonas mediterranea]|nr:hypothetical protein SRABI112_01673 [Pseudomonas mediterranea]